MNGTALLSRCQVSAATGANTRTPVAAGTAVALWVSSSPERRRFQAAWTTAAASARASAAAGIRRAGGLAGDQPVAAEVGLRLRERRVERRHDHVGGVEIIPGERLAVGPHERRHPREQAGEPGFVARFDGPHRAVVELVERRQLVVRELVLTLAREPDDHAEASLEPPPSPAPSWPAEPPSPGPSSAFIFSSSESTCEEGVTCASCLSMS